ncbi:hypothetical protein [Actinosynnema sp. NPDC020468]|uniref:hypothetical protein n=1 Tax=Actinosynnema sp. NPDC020468 TaxID=3154488 RepID=UPI0033E7C59E
MSTSPRRDAESGDVEPHVEEARFLGEEFTETLEACVSAVRKTPALAHVSHYGEGLFNLSADRLGPDYRGREALRGLGRRLDSFVARVETRLLGARTGLLIRTVLHTASGSLQCNSVVPGQSVVGLSRGVPPPDLALSRTPEVLQADRELSALATALRKLVRQLSQNPGGYESEGETPSLTSLHPPLEPWSRTTSDELPAGLARACLDAVRAEDLHYVAYCTTDGVGFEADQLAHPSLRSFFVGITVEARRNFYRVFSRELVDLARRFNQLNAGVGPEGPLLRLVLDVEQGAIYYYRLNPRAYLVGVTIDQEQVTNADHRLADLARPYTTR